MSDQEALDIIKAEDSLKRIQQDPPSSNFTTVVTPTFAPVVPITTSSSFPVAIQDLIALLNAAMAADSQEEGYLRAAADSMDRLQGALLAGDQTSAMHQLLAFQNFSDQTATAAAQLADLDRQILQLLSNIGMPNITLTPTDVTAFHDQLRHSGFPSDELAIFTALGFTRTDIDGFRDALLAVDPTSVPVTLFSLLDEDAQWHSALAAASGAAATSTTSHVLLLPATVSPNFTVNWSGTDLGSGIKDFTIFVSDNGGPFTAWMTHTVATSASYPGVLGHTYAFFSQVRDLVGNVEVLKTQAEATTQVVSALPGDLNGDGKVDCADLAIVKSSFGKQCGQPGFDPRADINHDCVINVKDLAFVAQKLPAGTHCP